MATEAPPAAPAAPAQAPIIIEGKPPAPLKPPTTQINVIPQPLEAKPAAKKGSVMQEMRDALAKKATGVTPATPNTPPAEPEPTPAEPGSVVEPQAEVPKGTEEPKKKVNPWKVVDEWKERAAAAEAKLAEAASKAVNPEEKAKLEGRLAELEARNKELAEEIKYENYLKSPEFKEQHEKPYEAAWEQAMGELSELTVVDGGEERPVNAQDLLQLVNMRLGEARDLAEEKFGHFANDVMIHRKKIKDLFMAKQQALESARVNTDERQKQILEQRSRQASEMQSQITQLWTKANDMALADPKAGKFFKAVEGDDDTNKRLERGYKMVDEAWSRNPLDPTLSPQDREKIVLAQAVVRHRSAAFGRVVNENAKLEARIAELEGRLKNYEESEPPTGGSIPANIGAPLTGSVMEQMKAKLAGMAK